MLGPALEELRRRLEHLLFQYEPSSEPDRDQLAFHRALQQIRLLFGGNQSGKSLAAAIEIVLVLLGVHPFRKVPRGGAKIWVVSPSWQNIESGIYKHLRVEQGGLIPDWWIRSQGAHAEKTEIPKWIELTNGSRVTFLVATGPHARKKFQAEDLTCVFVDEEVEEAHIAELTKRLYKQGGFMVVSATLEESEPWILELEERGESGDPAIHITRLSTLAAARAGHLDMATVEMDMRGMSEEQRDIRIYGHSKRSHGLIFGDFKAAIHCVPPRPIERECTRYMAIDPGTEVACALWVAAFPDQTYELYRCLYLKKTNVLQFAEAIYAAEGWERHFEEGTKTLIWKPSKVGVEPIQRRWIDPSAFRKTETGWAGSAAQLRRMGIRCVPANNDWAAGVQAVRELLFVHPDAGTRLLVQRHLADWLKERANYRSRHRDTDHAMDTTRYLFVQRPRYVGSDLAEETLVSPDDYASEFRTMREIERDTIRQLKAGVFDRRSIYEDVT